VASLVEQYEVVWTGKSDSHAMILDANIEPSQLRSLRYVRGGTTATPPELQEEFESRFNIPFMTTYGATEFAGAVASWRLRTIDCTARPTWDRAVDLIRACRCVRLTHRRTRPRPGRGGNS